MAPSCFVELAASQYPATVLKCAIPPVYGLPPGRSMKTDPDPSDAPIIPRLFRSLLLLLPNFVILHVEGRVGRIRCSEGSVPEMDVPRPPGLRGAGSCHDERFEVTQFSRTQTAPGIYCVLDRYSGPWRK